MPLEQAWIWLTGVLAGWLFLGLVAGRFNAIRRRGEASRPRPSARPPPTAPSETA